MLRGVSPNRALFGAVSSLRVYSECRIHFGKDIVLVHRLLGPTGDDCIHERFAFWLGPSPFPFSLFGVACSGAVMLHGCSNPLKIAYTNGFHSLVRAWPISMQSVWNCCVFWCTGCWDPQVMTAYMNGFHSGLGLAHFHSSCLSFWIRAACLKCRLLERHGFPTRNITAAMQGESTWQRPPSSAK